MTRKVIFWGGLALALLVFLMAIKAVLLPFVLGIFTAYLLDPVTDRLEKTGLSRGLATSLMTVGFFVLVITLGMLAIPALAAQLSGLVIALPAYVNGLQVDYAPKLSRWLGQLPADYLDNLRGVVSSASVVSAQMIGDFVSGIFQSGMAVVNLLSLFLITPVVAFYLLRDWDEIVARLDILLPRRHVAVIREQLAEIDATIAGFLRGQLNVCLILSAYYALGLAIVGLNFGVVIGVATGFLVIFPYVGLLLGMSIGMAAACFQFSDVAPILAVLAVFVTGQIMEGYFITPKLVGEKVGLHPVWIIFGMLAGGALFGFVGVLLAVPVTAVIGVLLRFAIRQYLQSPYYQ